METKYKVEILDEALTELRAIYDYIVPDNASAARRIFEEILSTADDLANYPLRGRALDARDKSMNGYHVVSVKPYLIFYKICETIIIVHHIIDGRRDYRVLLEY